MHKITYQQLETFGLQVKGQVPLAPVLVCVCRNLTYSLLTDIVPIFVLLQFLCRLWASESRPVVQILL